MVKLTAFFLLTALIGANASASGDLDLKIRKIIEVYQLSPCKPLVKDSNYEFGRFLFESKLLSGDRDVSCSTCHLKEKGLGDGLPLAVGVGGTGESINRLYEGKGTLVQRNAFSLFGRGNLVTRNFFWDGKIDTDRDHRIFSPFGDQLSKKFSSALSVAAILPLTERDEFLGKANLLSSNDFIDAAADKYYGSRYKALAKPIQNRLLNESMGDLQRLGVLATMSDPKFELADLGNALASFIGTEFGCRKSPWEKFLGGNQQAISSEAKEGAVLFFGKARCATCHSGSAFSDFKFGSIGVPQGDFGPATRRRDLGRAQVTNTREDMLKFRTPPLLAVGLTAPYGHNGIFETLEEVVLHHVNPLLIYLNSPELVKHESRLVSGISLDKREPRLQSIQIDSEIELLRLIEFLKAL